MKYIFTLALMLLLCKGTLLGQQDASSLRNMTKLGSFSMDSENESGEKDPVWKGPAKEKPRYLTTKTTGTLTKLIDLPQAQNIVNKIADALTKKEMNVSILSQHKYMINQCLGIKASVGEFKIKLGKPVAKLETGGIFLQFTIDDVSITGLTIRMRPCPKDAQCHFGGRFDVSGSASNVRLEIRVNPLVDLLNCQVFSGAFSPRFKWRIGGLNLKPLQNNLDEVAKNLIEDALTASAIVLMPNQLMDASISAIFDSNLCSGAPQEDGGSNSSDDDNNQQNSDQYDLQISAIEKRVTILEEKMKALENSSNSNQQNKPDTKTSSTLNKLKQENSAVDAEKWVITPSGLKGATGNVTITLPAGTNWYLYFQTTAGQNLVRLDNTKSHSLIPGTYNITVSSVPVLEVPVQKGMSTRLKAGTLHVIATGQWGLYDETQKTNYVTHGSPMKLGLPIGKYAIYLNGQFQQVEIKDGEVTEF